MIQGYLDSILESLPNTIGRGPAQVGATEAMAFGFTKPFFAARTVIVAACPPPKTTYSLSEVCNILASGTTCVNVVV